MFAKDCVPCSWVHARKVHMHTPAQCLQHQRSCSPCSPPSAVWCACRGAVCMHGVLPAVIVMICSLPCNYDCRGMSSARKGNAWFDHGNHSGCHAVLGHGGNGRSDLHGNSGAACQVGCCRCRRRRPACGVCSCPAPGPHQRLHFQSPADDTGA